MFFLGAWALREVLELNELDRDGAQDFTRPSSEVYRQFAAAMRAGSDGWHAKGDESDRNPASSPATKLLAGSKMQAPGYQKSGENGANASEHSQQNAGNSKHR
jgi:hypothetical protein